MKTQIPDDNIVMSNRKFCLKSYERNNDISHYSSIFYMFAIVKFMFCLTKVFSSLAKSEKFVVVP